jgi:sodium/proline symporter
VTVLVALLVFAAAVAWWGARSVRDSADYFAAGHRAGAWLVGVAGTAAAVSGFTFVGGPGLFALAGAGSLWIILSAPLTGALQCWAVGEPVVELVEKRRVLTIPELLACRFGGSSTRALAAVVVVVGCVASLAVQARAAVVLGEDFLRVPGVLAAVAAMLATTAYTSLGGMRAGLVADAAQGALMAGFAVLLTVAALAAAGGPAAAIATLAKARPDLLGSFGAVAPPSAWAWYLLFCIGTCAQPHYVQKFLFMRSRAQLRLLPAVLTGALVTTLVVWIGVGLGGSALVARGAFSLGRPDDLAPRTMSFLGPWAVLLAGVAVLAAMMSTTASFLYMAAAAVTRDLRETFGKPALPLPVARFATVLFAVAATIIGVASHRAVVLLGLVGWGFFTAALLPVMTVGLAWRGATQRGAVGAMAAGAAVDLMLESVRQHLPPGLEPGLAGAALGVLTLVAVSAWRRAQLSTPDDSPPRGKTGKGKREREDTAHDPSVVRFPFTLLRLPFSTFPQQTGPRIDRGRP